MKNFFRIAAYFLSFIALGAVAAFLVFKVVVADRRGELPDLTGKSIAEAEDVLHSRKLLLSIEGEDYHSEIPKGHIIGQSIKPGEKIKSGTAVHVMVSRGQEIYSMPSFEGQLLEDAKLTVKNLSINIKKVTWVHSDSVEKGRIIAQRPLSGNISGNEINFLVSLGRYSRSYRCPSFVNMSIDEARVLAGELGITLIEKEKGSKVIFQKPEAGTVISSGDPVEVRLGRGWGIWF